ncbi:MAG: serine protease [Pseudomonadota bacterium]|nr:serine protease [Pseudomonadota bacterium]
MRPLAPLLGPVAMALVGCTPAWAQTAPDDATLTKARNSVVQVQCEQKNGQGVWGVVSAATGFAWSAPTNVVTALHAVSGCGRVTVHSNLLNATRVAKVSHALTGKDLVLLDVDKQTQPLWSLEAMKPSSVVPTTFSRYTVLGIPKDMIPVDPTLVEFHGSASTLKGLLKGALLEEVTKQGWLDVTAAIMHFGGGHIAPGHSGAPIIDSSGRVVAIADGGLAAGALEIGWGIPVSSLGAILSAGTTVPAAVAKNPLFFSGDVGAPPAVAAECQGQTLTKVRSERFSAMRGFVDDPNGLAYLLNTFKGFGVELQEDYVFDILQDRESGATIVVPEGTQLEEEGGLCVARFHDGAFEFKASVEHVTSFGGAVAAALRYETAVAGGLSPVLDQQFSYRTPLQRFDGVLVNRKAYFLGVPGMPVGPGAPIDYVFQTLATNNRGALGVSVTDHMQGQKSACAATWWKGSACAAVRASQEEFLKLVMAVQMAGWSIG